MATSDEIKKRALELSEKTDSNSISPKEVGGIMHDLASLGENALRNGGTLGIRKVYASIAEMEADKNPKDLWGNPLKKGNLVVIYDGTTTGTDNNKVYAYMNPGWQLATHLDAGYATKSELTELASFTIFENAIFENKYVYTFTLGSAPSKDSKDKYSSTYVTNLAKGDYVEVNARSGSSLPTYAKVLNGVVVYVSATAETINGTIVCDGTFDALVFNNYVYYVAEPTCVVAKHKPIKEDLIKVTQLANESKLRIDNLEEITNIPTEENKVFENKYAYSFTSGSAPTKSSTNNYSCVYVDGLSIGDSVTANVRAGVSSPTYAKVLNGVVVYVGATAETINGKIVCDGTFDALVFNNYVYYVAEPTCIVAKRKPIDVVVSDLQKEISSTEKTCISILCFGNSFTQDSMSYVPFILKNVAPNVELRLTIAFIGGCPLIQHCVNLTKESMSIGGTTYGEKSYTIQEFLPNSKSWASVGTKSADELLTDKWDIITFQQSGSTSDEDWETYYAPYIFKIHKAIYDKVSSLVKLGWLSVHGAYQHTFNDLLNKWQGTIENTKKIESLTGNQVIFPYGTAVQNLRTTPLVNLGDGGFLMGDSAHLHEGIGCLAAAYANALTILSLTKYDYKSIIGEDTRPTKEWCTEINVPSPNYGDVTNDVVGISEDNCYVAQMAAIMAVKKPFEVTDCNAFVR